MIEELHGYLVPTAYLLLLFFLTAILFERYRKQLYSVLMKKYRKKKLTKKTKLQEVSKKRGWHPQSLFSWEVLIKALTIAGFVLFSRKLIYYVPLYGIIQTKFSIWWVESNAQTLLIVSIFVLFLIGLGFQMFKKDIEQEGCFPPLMGLSILVILGVVLLDILGIQFPITSRHLISSVFSPLLLLKILCSGKFLGFLTSFLAGYCLAAMYEGVRAFTRRQMKTDTKELAQHIGSPRPWVSNIHVKFMIATALMFIIFLGFSFYKSLKPARNWEQQLNIKLLSVTGESDMIDLMDAVHSIDREETRVSTLKKIALLMTKEQKARWKKEIYQRVIDAVKTLPEPLDTELLRKIALWIAETGDIPWAISVAEEIWVKKIRKNVLEEIRGKIEKK